MNYLIDTHALIWYAEGDKRLPNRIKDLIVDLNNTVYYSHASIWEMAIKISIDKLAVQITLPAWEALLLANGFTLLPLQFKHFEHLLSLPFHHNDPFDRLLLAQALAEDFIIITHDKQFSKYPVLIEGF
ncbi:MAG: type II toxin-antitoxin system VapC family toxin [Saprospiraceae bacterium]|nr:type II toxin-antitoxin system VapC family toxin [Saprospiraceae bacterium]